MTTAEEVLKSAFKGIDNSQIPTYGKGNNEGEQSTAAEASGGTKDDAGDKGADAGKEGNDGAQNNADDHNGEKKDENVDAGKPAEASGEKKDDGQQQQQQQVAQPDDISEDLLMQALKKRGIDVSNIEELKTPKVLTPEEIEAQNAQKRDNAIRRGLETGAFTSKQLSEFNVASAKPARDIAYELFSQEQKKIYPDVTAEEIAERFADKYGENLDEGHWLRKEGQEAMEFIKEAYLKNRYASIQNAESDYDNHINTTKAVTNYKNTVENIFSSLDSKYTASFKDNNPQGGEITKEYEYVFTPEEISAVKKQFLTAENFEAASQGELDPARLKDSISLALKGLYFDKIVSSISRSYASDMLLRAEAQRKGIMPEGGTGNAIKLDDKSNGLPAAAQKVVEGVIGKKKVA